MLSRATFLKRSLAAVGLLALGRVPSVPPVAAEPITEVGLLRDSLSPVRNEYALFASGGLCAPVTPYYNLKQVKLGDAFPEFKADRGGVRYGRLTLDNSISASSV